MSRAPDEFFRFPQTPHLAWLGKGSVRDDKILSPADESEFLSGEIVVEEKVDGANLGISVDASGFVRVQNRGSFVTSDSHPQFRGLPAWLAARRAQLQDELGGRLILFGEWCAAVHSVQYEKLPDWFLLFDVYDRVENKFWSTRRRNELARVLSLRTVPFLAKGHFTMTELKALFGPSRLGAPAVEGVYLRREDDDWLIERAKLVCPEFTQAMGEHWSRRAMVLNSLEELSSS